MKFFIRHREWFRGMAIASFVSLNFFMIAACWTGEDGAWAATFLIVGIAIVCSIIAQLTQDFSPKEKRDTKETTETEVLPSTTTNENDL